MTAPPKVKWSEHARKARIRRGCEDKRRFTNEATARAGAQIECERGVARRAGEMWVYPCEHCRGFHLTTKRGQTKWRVTATELYPPRELTAEEEFSPVEGL